MSRFIKFLALLLVTLLLVSCKSSPFSSLSMEKVLHGQVIDVLDGDTVKLRSDWHIYKIRLAGIDAPEKQQAYGVQSKIYLEHLIVDKDVSIKVVSCDQYGRYVGRIYLGGKDINGEMIRSGYAWHYYQYDSDPVYAVFMLDAQRANRGLWQEAHPTPPWIFRKGRN
ncbi:thermonuclease family protein [Phascolarctobacterium succinatutens]|uniref:thermonuclease family protein n=1 Tax=Phascolarctobacterium succinatutens TaxID=626940 RepID=UPI0026E945DD|nr:thermonuclease family protein [Phascolarctobacterium succinatutens]